MSEWVSIGEVVPGVGSDIGGVRGKGGAGGVIILSAQGYGAVVFFFFFSSKLRS